jgi:hypothetical protein
MTAVLDFPSDDRVAALVQCMQGRARRASTGRYQFSLGFDGLAAGPSVWDTPFSFRPRWTTRSSTSGAPTTPPRAGSVQGREGLQVAKPGSRPDDLLDALPRHRRQWD